MCADVNAHSQVDVGESAWVQLNAVWTFAVQVLYLETKIFFFYVYSPISIKYRSVEVRTVFCE